MKNIVLKSNFVFPCRSNTKAVSYFFLLYFNDMSFQDEHNHGSSHVPFLYYLRMAIDFF